MANARHDRFSDSVEDRISFAVESQTVGDQPDEGQDGGRIG